MCENFMKALIGNAVVGQSGGPTAAINATLSGVIKGTLKAKEKGIIKNLFGMRNGIEGFLEERLINLTERFSSENREEELKTLEATPAAILGSCRKKMKSYVDDPKTYEKLFEIFKKYDIRYFFYIGGNDSMDTVLKLSQYAKEHDYEIFVVGVPKTIDNDLMATDHTPGFGSAAKFVAATVKEIKRDISVYTMKAVTIVEIMGRDAGWLTSSAALASLSGDAPDLIYLPEKVFDPEKFIEDLKRVQEDHPAVLVAVSEGIKLADGHYVGEGTSGRNVDAFGHTALSGAGKNLEALVKKRLGCKVRSIELSLTQRCASHIASKTDIDESVMVGRGAVFAAIDGKTGVMMTINRTYNDGKYEAIIGSENIENIANEVRHVPDEYFNSSNNGISQEGIDYLLPLINGEIPITFENGLPKHLKL